jgi:hypothetical protein
MSVVSDIHDVLFDWFQLKAPETPCLHAGAVDTGEGLVVFPAIGKAGVVWNIRWRLPKLQICSLPRFPRSRDSGLKPI